MVAKKGVVGRCRASTSHLPMERGELNEKVGLPSQRTPIKYEKLGKLLKAEGYEEQKTTYLVSGFKDGFRLRLDRTMEELSQQQLDRGQQPVQNHKSADRKPGKVELKLKKELEAGRMLGPFPQPIFDYYCISSLGMTEKKVSGKYRLIQDLSAPREGLSVNDAIPVKAGAVSYDTVDNAVRMIQGYGQGSVLGKRDVEHAYKLVPIRQEDIPELGMRWGEDWLWDATLPMGIWSGCAIFEAFSSAVQFLAEKRGCGPMSHVLDDFLWIALNQQGA